MILLVRIFFIRCESIFRGILETIQKKIKEFTGIDFVHFRNFLNRWATSRDVDGKIVWGLVKYITILSTYVSPEKKLRHVVILLHTEIIHRIVRWLYLLIITSGFIEQRYNVLISSDMTSCCHAVQIHYSCRFNNYCGRRLSRSFRQFILPFNNYCDVVYVMYR